AVVELDDRLVGHRARLSRALHEVAQLAVAATPDAIDTRNERQLADARVVRPRSPSAGDVMQAGGEDLDEHFPGTVGYGLVEVAVARRLVERGDDGSFHGGSFG